MKLKPSTPVATKAPPRRTATERRALALEDQQHPMMAELRQQAEEQLRKQRRNQKSELNRQKPASDPERMLHELQVHQIELEMQNTELKDARDWMEGLVEKYTDLYDFAPVGYFSLDEKGVIREVNLTGAALLGVERVRLADGRFARFVAPASQPDFLAFLKRVFAGTGPEVCDLALVKEDGTDFWARFRGTTALSARDTRKWCRVSVSDITAHKCAEDALRASEERFRVAALAVSNLIWTNNPQGMMEGEQPGWAQFTGQTLKEYQGYGWARAVHPHDAQPTIKAWKAAVAEKRTFEFEHRVRRHDGLWRTCSIRALPVIGEDGEIREWVGVHNDITERVQAEEAIARLAAIVTSSEDAIISKKLDGLITTWNRGAERLLGYLAEEAVGQPLAMIFHHHHRVAGFSKRILKGETIESFETVCRHQDGRSVDVSLTISAITDAQGRIVGMSKIMRDITERKRSEATQRRLDVLTASNRKLELEIVRRQAVEKSLKESEQEQRQLLKESRRLQEQLRLLSHQILQAQEEERKRISRELHDEIAQTLTGINVRLANLKAGATIHAKDLQGKITSTQRLVEKSVEIVHRFARELRPSVLDDLGLIPALHSFVKTFSKETKLPVRLRIFAGVEKLDAAKRTVLYRVAQEALTNVARHAHATEVELCVEKLADAVRMKIKDNGRSFSVERTLLAKKNGRLGLLGMRERVEMVGGRFTLESAPGHGTTIEVQVPSSPAGKPGKTPSSKRPA